MAVSGLIHFHPSIQSKDVTFMMRQQETQKEMGCDSSIFKGADINGESW